MPQVQLLSFYCICAFFKAQLLLDLCDFAVCQFVCEELPKRRASEPLNPIYNIPRPITKVQKRYTAFVLFMLLYVISFGAFFKPSNMFLDPFS